MNLNAKLQNGCNHVNAISFNSNNRLKDKSRKNNEKRKRLWTRIIHLLEEEEEETRLSLGTREAEIHGCELCSWLRSIAFSPPLRARVCGVERVSDYWIQSTTERGVLIGNVFFCWWEKRNQTRSELEMCKERWEGQIRSQKTHW